VELNLFMGSVNKFKTCVRVYVCMRGWMRLKSKKAQCFC